MVYGATGYTGRLIARAARERRLQPILAGRDAAKLRDLAASLGFEYRAVRLDEPQRLSQALGDVDLVLNVAGPFFATARPMVEACLGTYTHYLDVTGEIPVFEELERYDAAARSRNVMVMPGVGFVVVATDCLSAHVARRLPGAQRLAIGISRTTYLSRGSARTIVELWSNLVHIRRQGRLLPTPVGSLEREFDYGAGPRLSAAVSWPDVITAFRTTGIPNIAVYLEVNRAERALLRLNPFFGWLVRPESRRLLRRQADLLPDGPSDDARQTHGRVVVAEAEDADGTRLGCRLHTPESYTFTCKAALGIVDKIQQGEFVPGFQTPAGAYGADFPLQLGGVRREEIAGATQRSCASSALASRS